MDRKATKIVILGAGRLGGALHRALTRAGNYRAVRRGFKVREIPITFEDRKVGKSKMSRKIFLEAMTMVWKLRLSGI